MIDARFMKKIEGDERKIKMSTRLGHPRAGARNARKAEEPTIDGPVMIDKSAVARSFVMVEMIYRTSRVLYGLGNHLYVRARV